MTHDCEDYAEEVGVSGPERGRFSRGEHVIAVVCQRCRRTLSITKDSLL